MFLCRTRGPSPTDLTPSIPSDSFRSTGQVDPGWATSSAIETAFVPPPYAHPSFLPHGTTSGILHLSPPWLPPPPPPTGDRGGGGGAGGGGGDVDVIVLVGLGVMAPLPPSSPPSPRQRHPRRSPAPFPTTALHRTKAAPAMWPRHHQGCVPRKADCGRPIRPQAGYLQPPLSPRRPPPGLRKGGSVSSRSSKHSRGHRARRRQHSRQHQ